MYYYLATPSPEWKPSTLSVAARMRAETWKYYIFCKKIKTFECGVMALVSTAELDFNDSEVVSLRIGAQK